MDIVQFILANYSTFAFVFIRTTAIFFAAPLFGAFNVPKQVKFAFSFLVALILTPLTGPVPMPGSVAPLIVAIGGEILIGAMIGLAVRFVFAGVEFAGQIASFQMGIGMASAYDPVNSTQVTVIGKMLSILTLLIFLTVNGHLMVIMALKKSFETMPPYGFSLTPSLMENIVIFSKEVFLLAVKFSAPIVAILVFVNIALGIMARTVPQLNMFVIGFAVTIFVGFVMIGLSLPVFETALMGVFDHMWEGIFTMIKAA